MKSNVNFLQDIEDIEKIEDIYPASYLQMGMLLESNLNSHGTYHDVFSYLVKIKFNKNNFLSIWNKLVKKHELLRSSFSLNSDNGWSVIVYKNAEIDCQIYKNKNTQELVIEESLKDFDYKKPGLFRLIINDLGEHFNLIFSFHHVIADGWSVASLINEFIQAYTNDKPISPNIRLRYGEYVRNELFAIQEPKNTIFWKEYLADLNITKSSWKFDSVKSKNGLHSTSFVLTPEQVTSIHKIAKNLKISIDCIFLLAYLKTLSYFTNNSDITIGLVTNNRLEKEEGDKLFGLFLNTIPFRFRFDAESSDTNDFIRVFNNKIKLQSYKQLPYGYLKSLFKQELYEFVFNFGHFNILSDSIGQTDSFEMFERTNIPFILNVSQFKNLGFSIKITAHDNYISQHFLEYFMKYYEKSLLNVLENPSNKLSLTGEDHKAIIDSFNVTDKFYSNNKTIFALFEEQVYRNPDSIALVYDDQQVSYEELNTRANQLAHYLRKQGVKSETLVAISVDRSLEMVIGLLGILKAGGAYLPLDPSYPQDRLHFMLEDANAPILLTQSHLKGTFTEYSPKTIVLDTAWDEIAKEAGSNPTSITNPKNLAYVIYTSGSTGRPKGVENTHEAISNRLLWTLETYPISQNDSLLHLATVGFDIAIWEMIFPLLAGGRLIIARDEENKDPAYLAHMVARWGISIVHFVPSLLETFLDQDLLMSYSFIKQVVCGGEGITVRLKEKFYQKLNARLYHAYGPTEAAISVTHWDCQEKIDQDRVPIGRPISNTQLYILDKSLNAVPIGVGGEIYIGGEGLARGYLNRAELTAERFIPNPFISEDEVEDKRGKSLRLYRTGDVGRYLPDGNIEFLGRIDDQVKIRGFRIELGEIESTLKAHGDVAQAVVIAREDEPGDKKLVAYVVPQGDRLTSLTSEAVFTSSSEDSFSVLKGEDIPGFTEDLRNHLGRSLPDYMIPSFFVYVDQIPLTPNGKTDRKSLPAPDLTLRIVGDVYVAPRNETEEELSLIWQEILKVDRVGINDNFFKLGGHSLLATQVISRIRHKYGIDIPLRALFEHPTIGALSSVVESLGNEKILNFIPPIISQSREGGIPLSFAQARLWFLDQLLPNVALYNMPLALRLEGKLQVKALEKAFNTLIERHESLRTIFSVMEGEAAQVIVPKLTIDLEGLSKDLSALKEEERKEVVEKLAFEEANAPFNLSTGPLIRVKLLVLSEEDHVLLITLHHIISDGWSMGIFFRELSVLYDAYAEGREPSLPSLGIQYGDFALWQRKWIQGEVLEKQLAYWKEQLVGIPDLLELPTDKPRPKELTYHGAAYHTSFSKEVKDKLNQLAQDNQVSLFMTLLTAFQILLYRYSGQKDIVVGSPIANRHYKETEDLIGFFVNTLALRTTFEGDESFIDVLNKVKRTTLQAYQHQDVSFEQLVDHLDVNRDLNRNPIFQVMFNFLTASNEEILLKDTVKMIPLPSSYPVAKFDLTLNAYEYDEGIEWGFEYMNEIFESSSIEKMACYFNLIVQELINNPTQSICAFPILTQEEKKEIIYQWNETQDDYPKEKSIHALFEEQVLKEPNSIALAYENEQLTYEELNKRANQLAHYLQSVGVGPETLVGVAIERSPEMIVSLLGILKAGGAYVPLDPSYPQDRLQFMLEDSGVTLLLTQSVFEDRFKNYKGSKIFVDRHWSLVEQELETTPVSPVLPKNLACLIYTSASSGKPKGVLIDHQLMLNRFAWMWKKYPFMKNEVCCQKTSLNFVDAIWEIFGPLLKGMRLVILPPLTINDPREFTKALGRESISRLVLVPSLLQTILDQDSSSLISDLKDLQLCVVSGEAVPSTTSLEFQRILIDRTKLLNLYGSTEIGADVTYYELNKESINEGWDGRVPIGRPISNMQTYILDVSLNAVPIGVTGELYIGGEGLARGYLNRAELTAERFIPNPFISEDEVEDKRGKSLRLYRTGDLGRYLPDGNIEFLGRIDDQVKIRGFRIELGEIESTLKAHGDVAQAVVIAREDEPGDKKLVAYVVPQGDRLTSLTSEAVFTSSSEDSFSVLKGEDIPGFTEDLRNHLGRSLPDYMIPSFFVYVDQIPLTPNGKTDRKSLPAPDLTLRIVGDVYVAPRNETEEELSLIWQEILKVDRVGINDNFFKLGGHSLLATQVISRIRHKYGIDIPLRALFEHPTIGALSSVVESLGNEKILNFIPPIISQSREGGIPLSFAQARLWFLDQLLPNVALYNMPLALRLEGKLQVKALEKAFNTLIERHESLRTIFSVMEGEAAQVIVPKLTIDLEGLSKDLSALKEEERKEVVEKLAFEEANAPFNLSTGPLIRVKLLVLSEEDHVLLITLHHIISDGWSMGIFFRELSVLYDAYAEGREPSLPSLGIQYGDFALWQRKWIQGEVLEKQLAYWKEQLVGIPDLLELPTDKPRPKELTYHGAAYHTSFSKEVKDKLNQLAQDNQVSLFMTLLTAFQILLYRYSGQKDIVVGSPIANRHYKETEDLIGFFVNTLALRTTFEGDESFIDVLNKVKRTTLQAYQHQDVSFEQLVDHLDVNRDLNRNPIFQVMFNFQNGGGREFLSLKNTSITPIFSFYPIAKFDLSLGVDEDRDYLNINMDYATDLFDLSTIERFTKHFEELIHAVIQNPHQKLYEISFLTLEENFKLLGEWNKSKISSSENKPIHTLFEEQASRSPHKIAVVYDGNELTYQELNERSNQLAHYLQSLGVCPETLVGIAVERSPEMIIGLLGILKAGAAYVPLDPSYPQDRLQFILNDTRSPVLLTQASLKLMFEDYVGNIFTLDQDFDKIQQYPKTNLSLLILQNHLAYIIYTSGSTGKPKGVMIKHENIARLLKETHHWYHFTENDIWTLFHSYAFDFSVWEIWGAFSYGGKLIIVPYHTSRSPESFYTLLKRERVTVLNQTPSAFYQLTEYKASLPTSYPLNNLSLRFVIFGGEALEVHKLNTWFDICNGRDKDTQLVNMYGITETTVHVTYFPISSSKALTTGKSIIGKKIPDLEVYILDSFLNAVPIGVVGELYIGGEGLARGYLNRAELTAERFIPNPFISEDEVEDKRGKSLRLYRTGDLGRYLPDGNIEFLGRIDDQVKIRGFRIELGEIESTLKAHGDVAQAVVIAREDEPGDKKLVAYVVPQGDRLTSLTSEAVFTSSSEDSFSVLKGEDIPGFTEDLRNHLGRSLPDYMIPSFFVYVDQIPLTPNGKTDRKSLPAPDLTLRIVGDVYVAPRNETEEELSLIWQEILKVDRVGINDNFFKLGGHSLLATQVISRIRHKYGIDIPLRALFEHPTIGALSSVVESLGNEKILNFIPPIISQSREGGIPLSFAQARLWFLDQLLPNVALYNMPLALRLEGKLQVKALEKAFNTLIERHESLRTIFSVMEGEAAQVIVPKLTIDLEGLSKDLSALKEEERKEVVEKLAFEEANAPFNLSTGPLIRVKLLVLSEEDHVLLITLHHIISDGWSMGIFFRELSVLYDAYAEGREPSLPSLGIQYGDFALWQRKWIQGEVLEKQLAYWKEQLVGIPDLLELPTDKPRPKELTYHGAAYHTSFSKEVKDKLNQLAQDNQVSLFMTLLTAFQILLYRYSGQKDIVVGSPIANRHYKETEDLIGFFVNTLALRTTFEGDESFIDVLNKVKRTTLQAYQHQDVYFDQLVDYLNIPRVLNRNPVFQVEFTFTNVQEGEILNLQDILITPTISAYTVTKFDLCFNTYEDQNGIGIGIAYATDLFEERTIKGLAHHFKEFVEKVIRNPFQSIETYDFLTYEEKKQILITWNNTKTDDQTERKIHQIFEEQANKTPNNIAVVYEDKELTYKELNEKANQLAHYLRNMGVGSDTLVAIAVERSPEMIIGLLGILKAGGAYVPLDPTYPRERLQFIIEDTNAPIILTDTKTINLLPVTWSRLVCLDEEWEYIKSFPLTNLDCVNLPNHLAYVIYTSGSTGKPKGVMVEHSSFLNHMLWMKKEYNFSYKDTILQRTAYSFDASVWEIFMPLICGSRMVLVPSYLSKDFKEFYNVLLKHNVTTLQLVPSLLMPLLNAAERIESTHSLKNLFVGGEVFSSEMGHILLSRLKVTAINLYGPTEATIDTTSFRYNVTQDLQQFSTVPIGQPISNMQTYILDSFLNAVPIGVVGELYIGGEGLARGYLNRAELTAERFIPNPFISEDEVEDKRGKSLRLYRTGDLGRYLPDGNIEFLGRIDDQVKIRGFRIELGEIESTLKAHGDVAQAVVIAREDEPGDKKLVAYVVPQGDRLTSLTSEAVFTSSSEDSFSVLKGEDIPGFTEDLRNHLGRSLPDYMIPSFFVYVDQIPLTPNGKTDRKSLPAPDLTLRIVGDVYVAPRNETEEELSLIWQEILKVDRVGINDNFFKLGGHSLLATQVISRIRHKYGIDIPLRALFEHPTIGALSSVVESLGNEKILNFIPPIISQSREGGIPLSFAQARLWFLDQLLPNVALYNMPLALRLEGKLQVKALEKAFNTLIERHESLRTIFSVMEGEAAQVIVPKLTIDLEGLSKDLSALKEEERKEVVEKLAFEEANAPFNLSTGPLIRVKLLVLSEEDHVLLITLHHIISDGWSMGIFFRELSVLYDAYAEGREPSLPSLGIQYGDFALWQRKWIQGEVLEKQLAYWKEQLVGIPDLLELPTDKPRPKELTYHGAAYHTSFSKEVKDKLNQLAQDNQVSLFMTLLTAFQILLYRYSGQKDIVVGSPIANRHYKETEDLIGFFVNTLALRTTFEGDESFIDVLNKVKRTTLQAYQHQDVSFEQLVDHLDVNRDLNRNPIFQVMFNFLTASNEEILLKDTVKMIPLPSSYPVAKFDLTLNAYEYDEGIEWGFEYMNEIFESSSIEKMACYFNLIVQELINNPTQSICAFPILTQEEKKEIIYQWNETQDDYPKEKSIHALFEEQVLKEPNSIALAYENEQLTYEELNKRANQLAHYLQSVGVGPETLVGVAIERSPEMIVSLLGILKAGGAYVPLDPSYPQDRLQFMLEDSGVTLLLTQSVFEDRFKNYKGSKIFVDRHWSLVEQELETTPVSPVLPKNLACLIYTSASSGKPKGVLIDHQLMLNRFAWMWKKYPFMKNEVCCQKTSLNFVDAIWEIFGPLLKGMRLVILPPLTINDPREFTKALGRESISRLVLVPSLLQTILDQDSSSLISDLKDLQLCVVSGEAVPSTTSLEFQRILIDRTKLLNLYGSTEIGADVTYYELNKESINEGWDGRVPIGRPISNMQTYILDVSLNAVPIGVTGELYIGGEGLARGYLNRAELTAERFIPNPFISEDEVEDKRGKSLRLYRTGDLGRYLPDGNIEFLGRIDDQVKIRGFRIELGEIESTLKAHGDVAQAVVIAREDEPGDKKLVAYVVPQGDRLTSLTSEAVFTSSSEDSFSVLKGEDIPGFTEDLRNHLGRSLPDHMIPSFFVYVDQIPLTPNGKTDRKSLPKAEFTSIKRYIAPESKLEAQMSKIWAEVLGINHSLIGMEDNFFDIGGNSILTIHLRTKIEKEFGIKDFSISNLFKYPTIKTLRDYLLEKEINHRDNYQVNASYSIKDFNQEIAVIAMSAEFPSSSDIEEFWYNIVNGRECLEVLSEDSCRKRGVPEFVLSNKNYIPIGGIIKNMDKFDPDFWKISPKDAILMDPQIRKFLEHSWSALEKSGYIGERHKRKVGVFAGMSESRYYQTRIEGNNEFSQMTNWEAHFVNSKDFLATKVSYLLGLTGISLNINTACSTALVAIVEACKNLALGQCDVAIAGGAALQMPENHGYIYTQEMIFSKDGHCKVFDKDSSGTVFGAGVGVVVLKRLKNAIADKDNIIAIVKGYATNNDGNRKVGYTAPSVIGQTECILEAQNLAQVTSDTIDYVECHGTGTSLGDPIEIAALHDAFKINSEENNKYNCTLGALKANIGHADSAAGVAGFIKVCKMLQDKIIPPQIHFNSPNPNLNFDKTNFKIVTSKQEWVKNANNPRRGGVSAFGIGGTNAHVILEEYTPKENSSNQSIENQFYMLPISAKSLISYKQYCSALADYLDSNLKANLGDVAYTLQYKREYFDYRNIIVAKEKGEVINQLRNIGSPYEIKHLKADIIFMFSGQGAQYPNMTESLYNTNPIFKTYIDRCCKIISDITNTNFKEYLYPSLDKQPKDYLRETRWAQPALFAVCYSLAKLFESFDVSACSYIGHSIGEYVAATLSGVFKLEDAIKVVIKRGELMQEMPKGSMLTINLSIERIKEILPKDLEISVYNAPQYNVVSGEDEEINLFKSRLDKLNISCSKLHTSHAFHSKMMEQAARNFEEYLTNINLNKPNKLFISNVSGNFISDEQAISPSYWANHIRVPVKFSQGIENLIHNYENPLFVEIGPGNILSNFVSHHKNKKENLINSISTLSSAKNYNKITTDELHQFYNVIGKLWTLGHSVNWLKTWKTDINNLRIVDIPAYQFAKNEYWIDLPEVIQKDHPRMKPKGEWYYQLTWKRVSKVNSAINVKLPEKHDWIVFRDNLGKLDEFINYLKQNGQNVVVVDYNETDKNISIQKNQIIMNLYNENHYTELANYLANHHINVSYVVHGWTITEKDQRPQNELTQYLGFYSLTILYDKFFSKIKKSLHLFTITNGLNQVTGKEFIQVDKGTMLGAIRTLPHENQKIKACMVDVGFDSWITSEYLLSLITTKNNYVSEANFSIRSGYLWKEEIEPINIDNEKYNPIIKDNDVILISGGLGGIALATAKEISKHHKVKFILVSRRNINKLAPESKKIKLDILNLIRHNNCDVEIYYSDISKADEVEKLVSSVTKKYGKINGVIHAAGVPPLAISKRNLVNIKEAMSGKVLGAENLLNALEPYTLKFFIMTSSMSSLIGDVGTLEYCAANSYLDVLSGIETRNINHLMSINWPVWSEIGMSITSNNKSSNFEKNDIFSLIAQNNVKEDEGAEIFYNLINQQEYKHVAVSKVDIRRIKQELFEDVDDLATTAHKSKNILIEEDVTDLENKIGQIFCQILGHQKLSKHDSYFELGGNSLSAIKMTNQLNKKLNTNIAFSVIYKQDTIEKLAKFLNYNTEEDERSSLSIIDEGEL